MYLRALLFILSCFVNDLFAFKPLDLTEPGKIEGETFFITPFRSGTNLTLCSLQLITKKPVRWLDPRKIYLRNCDGTNRLGLDLDNEKKPLYREHSVGYLSRINPATNHLIMVIRNPKEVIIRYCKDDLETFKRYLAGNSVRFKYLSNDRFFQYYLDLLRFFDNWKGAKHLIYYEDLLLYPEETLSEVLDFMQESREGLEDYLENMEGYREMILESYSLQHKDTGGAVSKGRDVLYHSNKVPSNFLIRADQILQIEALDLWKKYLQRYATEEE